jgi:hypothetical protein
MNFEFIRDIDGLNRAFDSCSNAEELAISMPDLSMIASRKSAEVLAKFVYLVSHSEEAEDMSFADILSNDIVKQYLNNRNVLEAFHFIRKNGNIAVHTLENKTSNDSLKVLKNLHFAFGEVAKRMRLITKYPQFDANLELNESAKFEDIDVNAIANAAYSDYILALNRVEKIKKEFMRRCSKVNIIPGLVDLNEVLEFKNKPLSDETISYIQEHFAFLAMYSLNAIRGELHLQEFDTKYSCELTIYGDNGYTTQNHIKFIEGILYDLPHAEGFKITSIYQGPSVAPWFNAEVREEFRSTVSKIGKTESFTYSIFEFLYNHGSGGCSKFENGKWVNLESQFSTDIIDCDFGEDWWCWNMDLSVEFDFDKHPKILESLHNTVRKHVPVDQLQYCEKAWKGGDVQILLNSITWTPRTLRPVQDFLDEINIVLAPIIKECDGWGGDFCLCQTKPPFAVADFVWSDIGFSIRGVKL